MRNIFWLLMTLIVISACSSTNTNEKQDAVEVSTLNKIDTKDQIRAENVINDYYNAFIRKDYQKTANFISSNFYKLNGFTKEKFITIQKENDFKNDLKLKEFMISDLNTYDENHMYGKVNLKGKANGEPFSTEEKFMLVKEDNNWKMDFTGIVDTILVDSDSVSGELVLSEIVINHIIDNSYQVFYRLSNHSQQEGISYGWVSTSAKAILVTDKDTYQIELKNQTLEPSSSVNEKIIFHGVNGKPEKLMIKGLLPTSNGLPINNKVLADITIDLDDKN